MPFRFELNLAPRALSEVRVTSQQALFTDFACALRAGTGHAAASKAYSRSNCQAHYAGLLAAARRQIEAKARRYSRIREKFAGRVARSLRFRTPRKVSSGLQVQKRMFGVPGVI
jgi:hypothetical protein